MGLMNKVVSAAELMNEARAWAQKIAAMSPTAITLAKASFKRPERGDPRHRLGRVTWPRVL
jgi:enoyl-CoA hydratase/carnithine racemase